MTWRKIFVQDNDTSSLEVARGPNNKVRIAVDHHDGKPRTIVLTAYAATILVDELLKKP